jgi:glycosyltransferase involved in cell wall biosynthesis
VRSAGVVGHTDTMSDVLMVTGLVAGGVGRHVEQLTRGLTARGHRVVVACPPPVAAAFSLADAGATVVEVEIGARPAPHRDHRAVSRIRDAMGSVEVVHAHGLRAGALTAAARRRWPRDAASPPPPLVVTHHNAAPERTVASVVHRGLERMVVRGADVLLAVSPDLVRRARELGAARADLAVVPATPRPVVRDAHQVRADLELDPADRLLVGVGRLAPQKGFDHLLEAMALLRDVHPEAVLVLAGDGPQREALQHRIDREDLRVRLLGHRDDVPDLLAAADLVVSAARWEGQPVWLQEALAVGAPVVATDVGGTATVLGRAGLLVPGDDPLAVPAALAEQVARVLADPALREELAASSTARAAELPSVQEAVDAALAAYARAVHAAPSS